MAPKKAKAKKTNVSDTYLVIRDEKTSRCCVIAHSQLNLSKKDTLKIGSNVRFKTDDASSDYNTGTIVLTGTKEQCETSLSLIEKTNDNNKNLEMDSDEQDGLMIDEKEESPIESNRTKAMVADRTPVVVVRKPCTDKSNTISQKTNSSNNISANDSPSSSTASATSSPNFTSSKFPDENSNLSNTQKDTSDEYVRIKQNKRKKISVNEYESLKQQVKQLEKKIENYETHWMPRPNHAAAAYFVEIGKILGGTKETLTNDEKSEKLEQICEILNMSDEQLRSCEHKIDITKTCREIVRFIYPNSNERAKLLISTMNTAQLKAIQDYARLVHPAQASLPNSVLNNAIGNVFAVEKRKRDQIDADDDDED